MHIAIYSGSFNPIHLGHYKLAKHLLEQQLVDEVWFVVSPQNPLKDDKNHVSQFQRMEMVLLTIAHHPRMKVSAVEFNMPLPSYTIDTLKRLSALYPQNQFSLMIGSDNAVIFNQWKDYQDILDNYPIFVYPRKGYDFSAVAKLYPQMQILQTAHYDISSTEIRERIKTKNYISDWLEPKVEEYIAANHLYV